MGTTLTGKRVQNTYDSLLKLSDNDNLTGVAKVVGDGLGNDSPIYLSTSKIGIGVSPTYQFQTSGDGKFGGSLIIAGNLTVNGTTTIVDSTIVAIGDNMIEMAKDNTANTMDIGWYGTIVESGTKYVGTYYDAGSGVTTPTFYIGLGTTEPSSTASWTVKGKIVIGQIDSTGGTFSGQITIPETPTADGHAASKKYVDDQIGGADKARRVTIEVKNTETIALSKGTVVHAEPTASPPSGNLVEIKKADYDTPSLMPAIGILNEDLDAAGGTNDEGEAIMFGFINGIDTSSFSAGDELYVGNDGSLTNSKPLLTTQLIQKIAVVMKVDSTNGSIEVFGAGRSNDVPNEVDRDLSIAGNLKVDDYIEIEADSGYGRLEIGGPDGGYIDLKTPFSDDYDLRIITNSSGSEFTGSGDFNINAGNTLTLTLDGSTQDATFAGNIGVSGKSPTYGISLGQGTSNSNKIVWTDLTPSFRGSIFSDPSDDKFKIATPNTSNVETVALEIDTSQNVTFNNNVIINGTTGLSIPNGRIDLSDGTSYDSLINANSSLVINIDADNNSTGETFKIATNSNTTTGGNALFTINESATATFAGSIIVNNGNATFNPDADSQVVIKNAGTDAVAVFAGSGDSLYLGSNDTTGLYFNTSNNATFVGNIETSSDKRISVGTWDNSAFTGGNAYGFSVTSSLPLLHLTESDQTNKKGYVGLSGGSMYIGGLISNLYLQTGTSGSTALTIDSSQNSTFAGAITGTSASLTTSGTVLSLDRTGGATALIELKVGGTVEGYLGANSTKSLIVYNESAAEKFSISNTGNATFTGQVHIDSKPNSGLAYNVLIDVGSSGDGTIGYQTVDQLAANIGASSSSNWVKSGNNIYNTNSGNVGIGISSGIATKLHIKNAPNNTVCYVEDTTGYALFQLGNTGGGLYFGIDNSAGTGFNIGSGYSRHIYSTGTNDFHISTNALNRITINGSSGTTSFYGGDFSGATVTWKQANRRTGYLYSDTAGVGIFDTALSNAGIYLSNNNRIDFRVNGSQIMVIDSSGRVGIGITSGIAAKLHTYDSSSSDVVVAKFGSQNYNTGNKTYIELGTQYGDGGSRIGSFNSSGNASNLVFETMTTTSGVYSQRMIIDRLGKVGIGGVTSPLSEVHIKGSSGVVGFGNSILTIEDNASNYSGIVFKGITNYNAAIRSEGGTGISFWQNGGTGTSWVQRMQLDSSGHLNIWNASPTSSKHIGITNTSGTTGWTFGNGVTANAHQFVIYDNSAGQEKFKVVGSGEMTFNATQFKFNSSNPLGFYFNTTSASYGAYAVFQSQGSTKGELGYNASSMYFGGFTGVNTILMAGASNIMYLNTNGNVGIGHSTPQFGLTLAQGTGDGNRIGWEDGASNKRASIICSSSTDALQFHMGTSDTERMRLQTNGDLHADGDVVAYSTTISDARLKDNVVNIDKALEKVKQLRGVEYVWNKGSKKGQKDLGVIAQEVEEILPEIVKEKEMAFFGEETYKTVDYEKLTAVLIESVKELSAKVEALENKCNCNCK